MEKGKMSNNSEISEVENMMRRLQEAIEELGKEVSALEGKLIIVLSPAIPAAAKEQEVKEPLVPLAEEIQGQTEAVKNQVGYIRALIDRIKL